MKTIIYADNEAKHRHENYPAAPIPNELKGVSWSDFEKQAQIARQLAHERIAELLNLLDMLSETDQKTIATNTINILQERTA